MLKGETHMYNDLNFFIDENRINYTINKTEDKLKITCRNIDSSKVKIYYDDNVYNIILNKNMKKKKSNTIEINLTKEKEFTFTLELKDTYLVKTVYKYINELIDKDKLIEEINLFKNYNSKKEYKEDLNKLIRKIDKCEEEIEELIINHQSGYRSEYTKIVNILTTNNTYKKIVNKMTNHELMLLITWYISNIYPPHISEELFHELVEDAIQSEDSLENVWRLAMTYDNYDFNYDEIDKFFINSKDAYYISEYISGVLQVSQEKITNMLIEQDDKDLIKEFLNKYVEASHLQEKYINILKEHISRRES